MQKAKTLRELLQIRDAKKNREYISSIAANMGSAIGLKNGSGDPCIIIFVPRKIEKKWLPQGSLIKRRLSAGGIYCPTDIVEGRNYDAYDDVNFVDVTGGVDGSGVLPVVSKMEILGPKPLTSPVRIELLEQLRGWSNFICPGSQLYHPLSRSIGTLGCFVRNSSGKRGILTNKHVAGDIGSDLIFPDEYGRRVAVTYDSIEMITDESRFPGVIDEPYAHYTLDCAFAEFDPSIGDDDFDPRIPTIDSQDQIVMKELGAPLSLDLDTMDPLGQSVIGVGRTRSFQRGTIYAMAYTWNTLSRRREVDYTDYLIAGEDAGDTFSSSGDSGKLIVTNDGSYRPVALLWGGWMAKLKKGQLMEDWTYAIDINVILEQLKVSIVRRK